MNRKYSKEKQLIISKEAIEIRNGKIYPINSKEIALKYGVHISTIYSWIDKYHRKKEDLLQSELDSALKKKKNWRVFVRN